MAGGTVLAGDAGVARGAVLAAATAATATASEPAAHGQGALRAVRRRDRQDLDRDR